MSAEADGYPRDALRVRRYVNGTLEREYTLTVGEPENMAGLDAQWCVEQVEAGNRYRIVIDDPWGDVAPIILHGGPA